MGRGRKRMAMTMARGGGTEVMERGGREGLLDEKEHGGGAAKACASGGCVWEGRTEGEGGRGKQ